MKDKIRTHMELKPIRGIPSPQRLLDSNPPAAPFSVTEFG